MGGVGPDLHALRSRDRDHAALRNQRLDPPLHRQSGPVVPMDDRGARGHGRSLPPRASLGSRRRRRGLGRLLLDPRRSPRLWYAGRPALFPIRRVIEAVWRFVVASALAGLRDRRASCGGCRHCSPSPARWERSCGSRCVLLRVRRALSRRRDRVAPGVRATLSAVRAHPRDEFRRRSDRRSHRRQVSHENSPEDARHSKARSALRALLQAYGAGPVKKRLWDVEFAKGRWDCLDRHAPATAYIRILEKYANNGQHPRSRMRLGQHRKRAGHRGIRTLCRRRHLRRGDRQGTRAERGEWPGRQEPLSAVGHFQLRARSVIRRDPVQGFDLLRPRRAHHGDAPALRAVSRGRRRLHRQDGGRRQVPATSWRRSKRTSPSWKSTSPTIRRRSSWSFVRVSVESGFSPHETKSLASAVSQCVLPVVGVLRQAGLAQATGARAGRFVDDAKSWIRLGGSTGARQACRAGFRIEPAEPAPRSARRHGG